MIRKNLAIDPSLRSGTTNAYEGVGGATLLFTDDYAFYGKGALRVVKSASNSSGVRIASPVAVSSGLPYAFSVYTALPISIPREEPAEIVLTVEWMNSLNVIVKSDTSTSLLMEDDNTWYRISGVWVAPAGATRALLKVYQPLPGTAAQEFLVDAFLIEQSSYVRGYMDNISQEEKNKLVTKALSAVPQVINGVRLAADISINGLVLNTIDESGTIWVVTDISGWWGQSAPEVPNIGRGTEDGSYDVEGRLTARTIAVTGFFIPTDTEQSLNAGIDRLVTAFNMVRTPGWFIANEGPTKAALVRLADKPSIETVNARGKTEFEVVMRAGDPTKYHWNDDDPFGYTHVVFNASDVLGEAENLGTADVPGVFRFTGPVGAGTYLANASNDRVMTLKTPLRGAGLVADVTSVYATAGVATVRTSAPHGLLVGDEVSLLNMVIPFSESSVARKVTHVSNIFPYSFSFSIETDDVEEMDSNGQVFLTRNDVLEVDTYTHTVSYNGDSTGQRHRLTTLTDWVTFSPGTNYLEFSDQVPQTEVVSKTLDNNTVTLVTKEAHYLIPGEAVAVELPEEAKLSRKQLQGNSITLTTEEPHGFSVGDTIEVQTTETSTIVNKSRASNAVAITTQDPHGVSAGDVVDISLPTTALPIGKALQSNVATITTAVPHGFSVADSVTVALPTTSPVSGKKLSGGQATIFTSAPHNFSLGDSVTVNLPTTTNVVGKARSGSLAIITTSSAHGFSIGDQVQMSLPVTTTINGGASITPSTGAVSLTTSAAHGLSVGDRVSLAPSSSSNKTVTNRSATTTACTLTFASGNDWVVGERILVTGVGARYNGTFIITAVTATTVTYTSAGAAEASTSSSGAIQNRTLVDTFTGEKIVESTPTATTFTYKDWTYSASVTRPTLTGTLTNLTNQRFNGIKTLVSASGTSFAYNY